MMERAEPVLVPEWYKAANGGNHNAGSSTNSGEHGSRVNSRNRTLVSPDFSDGSSNSSGKSSSSNGSLAHDKGSIGCSHPYSSFGRSRRERDRDDDRARGSRSSLVDNGYRDDFVSFKSTNKLRRSLSSGRQNESGPKEVGSVSVPKNGAGSAITGTGKVYLERFPSLGAEEKQRFPERVCSPVLTSAVQSLPISSLTLTGGDSWTSALAEVPMAVGGNGLILPPVLHNSSTMTGLNMAEALAQTPSRDCTPPQSSVDRIDERTLKQFKQLIPLTPSMPKTSVFSSSDKAKSKGTKGDLSCLSKVGQQSSSQLANTLRAPRSDIPKTSSQAGHFQVLNRGRNGTSCTVNGAQSVGRAANSVTVVTSAAIPSLKGSISPNHIVDNKGTASSSMQDSFGDKRPLTQAKDRYKFFNSIRSKTSMNHSTRCEKLTEQCAETGASVDQEGSNSASNPGLCCSSDNGNCVTGSCNPCVPETHDNGENASFLEPVPDPNEEEVAFLKLLGWDQNAGEEEAPLTAEEIAAFFSEYGHEIRPRSC